MIVGKKYQSILLPYDSTFSCEAILSDGSAAGLYYYGSSPIPFPITLHKNDFCKWKEVPKIFTKWINIYGNEKRCFMHDSKRDADINVGGGFNRIACIEIKYTEGEGLA